MLFKVYLPRQDYFSATMHKHAVLLGGKVHADEVVQVWHHIAGVLGVWGVEWVATLGGRGCVVQRPNELCVLPGVLCTVSGCVAVHTSRVRRA